VSSPDATELLDLYEQSTISTDDGWLSSKNDLPALTLAEAVTRSCRQIDDALERYHTVVHPYFHPVSLRGGRALPYPTLPWLEAMLAHCRRRGVPALNSEQWIDWNDARRAIALAGYAAPSAALAPGEVRFSLSAGKAIQDVAALLPLPAGASAVEVLVDGEPARGETVVERHGRRYATATLSFRAGDEWQVTVRWS